MNKFVKKLMILTLSLGIMVGSLAGCGQKATENENTQVPTQPEIVQPIEEEIPSVVPEEKNKIDAGNLVANMVEEFNYDFAKEYDNGVLRIVGVKYDTKQVERIASVQVENGKVTIFADVKDENNNTKTAEIVFEGDTTGFVDLTKSTKSQIISRIIEDLALEGVEFEENSNEHKELVAYVNTVLDTEKTKVIALGGVDLSKVKEIIDEPVIVNYVSVKSIVDQIWGDVDTEKDVFDVAKTMTENKYKNNTMEKLHAVEVVDGNLVFYIVRFNGNNHFVATLTIDASKDEREKFFNVAREGKNAAINDILQNYELTMSSEVEENSAKESQLKDDLTLLKTNYQKAITSLTSATKDDVKANTFINIHDLTQAEMNELDITSYNAFANALQTNQKGDYDLVQGWTMDDVLATYVSEPNGLNINRWNSFRIWVVTNEKIYELGNIVYYAEGLETYRRMFQDNPNVKVARQDTLVEFSDNAIIYDANDTRVDDIGKTLTSSTFYEK